jgi:hypothetical protein
MELLHFVIIACVYLWIGFTCAISFMEAWIKFKAPGVTLPIGLGIGRLVFNALNKTEWFFACVIVLCMVMNFSSITLIQLLLFIGAVFILSIQTLVLLPSLDARAQMHINGQTVAASPMHIYFVGLEVCKVGVLCLFSISIF